MTKLYKSQAWLQQQRKNGLTAQQIADLCDVSRQMIVKQLQKFGIK